MENLVLIDGNSILYRAFYATPYFSTSTGIATNAVYGFINMLLKIITEISPTHMLVAFDRKEPTYRHQMYSGYKATRKPMPDELVPQVDLIKKTLKELGITIYEKAGLEADDIIGSCAKKFKQNTIIVTGDKDSFQLVDETTSVFFTRKGISEHEVFNCENFKEKTGIEPIQIIDLKACMGDTSDNIPGIPGVGEKTALNLVSSYGNVENLYLHLDDLKGKLKEKVELGRDSAFMSKQLATINVNAEIPYEIDDLKFSFPFSQGARKFFATLEFNTFLKKNIFSLDDEFEENNNSEKREKRLIKSTIIKDFTSDVVFDANKNYALIIDDKIHFSDGETEYTVLIKETFFDDGLNFDEALKMLNPLFSGSGVNKLIVFDKKRFLKNLTEYGITLNAFCEDVMLQKYVVDFTTKELDVFESIEHGGFDLQTPSASLYFLFEKYDELLKKENLQTLYYDVELPLCDVLFDMERAGFKLDGIGLEQASKEYHEKIDSIYRQVCELAGGEFNLNSSKQLAEVFFDKLGLKHGKKTKTGYSTGVEVLEDLKDEHPIVPLILRHRQLQKICSTYIDGFKPLIDKNTGLIHTVFNQAVTSTGRLSSKEPNLQNIPVRTEEGREIRKFFIPRNKNNVLIGADYSQIELRLLAHYSGCEPLIQAFNRGDDIHAITASQVFDVPIDQVTNEQRRTAKAVNFGIIYGISDYGLSETLKISPKTASEYIKKYFEMYPSVKKYMDDNVAFAKENGYICTAFGRKRIISELKSSNYNVRSFGERAAMNMPLQGTAADIIKMAMINVHKRLKTEVPDALLILQVHDELIVDAPESAVELVKNILEDEMQNTVKLSVPLTVNVAWGKTWFEAK